MIFRTITDDFTGSIRSIGIFGKSLNELKTKISTIRSRGIIESLFNTSTLNFKAIDDYNAAITEATAHGATMAENRPWRAQTKQPHN